MDLDSIEAVDAHYETHFGAGSEYWKFHNRPGTIGLLEWPKGTSRHGLHIYATLGLHALVPAPLNHAHGFELIRTSLLEMRHSGPPSE
jgi:hypothetical protein